MATVAQFNQDQNQPQPGQNQGGSGQVINSTGGGGATGIQTGQTGAGGAYSPPRTPLAGGPNIEQYLQANQGAGQQLSQGIQNTVQSQAQNLNQQQNTYQNQLNAQYNPLQQNLGQNAQQTTQTAFQNPQQLIDAYNAAKTQSSNQPLTNPQQQAANQYNQFQQLNAGGYNPEIQTYGATGQQYNNQLQNQLSGLQKQAQAANTEMGRNQLLQNTVGQPNYNIGQQSLDALFLQAQPGVANQLQQNLGNIATQAGQNVSGFNTDLQNKISGLQGLSNQDQQQIHNLFNTGLSGIASNVSKEYANTQAAQPEKVNALQAAANAGTAYSPQGSTSPTQLGKFTLDQLNQLGITNPVNAWGVNLSPYIHSTQLNAADQGGNAQVATPEEFARYNALNNLLGGPTGPAQASIFGGATQAGGFNPVSFDTNAFNQAVAQRKDALTGADLKGVLQPMEADLGGYGYIGSNIVSNIQNALKNNVNPNQILAALKNPQYETALGNSVASGLAVAGLNHNFGPLTMYDYNQSLTPLANWLNTTYNPAANDILGGSNPFAGKGGPQGGVASGGDAGFVMPGVTPTTWQSGGFGSI